MSGYLHRMLGHLRAPATSGIRPLVGSLYTSASATTGLHEVHEEIASTRQAQTIRPHEQAPVTPASFRESRVENFFPKPEPHTAGTNVSTDTPTIARSAMPLMPEKSQLQPATEQSYHQEFPDRTPIESSRESAAKPDAAAMQTLRVTEIASVQPVASRPQPLMPRQARTAPLPFIPVAAVHSTAVADEIHINIGRIEVTAVPQAPASRPAPRQPRRGFSLDDYLRKSDGRAQ